MFWNKKKVVADTAEVGPDYRAKFENLAASQKETEQNHKLELASLKQNHQMEIDKLKNDHSLALSQKEFELNHSADERVKEAEGKAAESDKKLAVAAKENEMLVKITDLNKDVIDVKELVTNIINKLPTVNITSAIGGGGGGKQDKG